MHGASLFNLLKVFDEIKSSTKLNFAIFLHACATFTELPSNIGTMPFIRSSSHLYTYVKALKVKSKIYFMPPSQKVKYKILCTRNFFTDICINWWVGPIPPSRYPILFLKKFGSGHGFSLNTRILINISYTSVAFVIVFLFLLTKYVIQ